MSNLKWSAWIPAHNNGRTDWKLFHNEESDVCALIEFITVAEAVAKIQGHRVRTFGFGKDGYLIVDDGYKVDGHDPPATVCDPEHGVFFLWVSSSW